MRKNRHFYTLFFLLLILSASLNANILFSSRESRVIVNSGKFLVNTPITDWNGTLEVTGAVRGSPISFSNGILEAQSTPAFFTGDFDGDASRKITLKTNQSFRSDAGALLNKLTVVRGGNLLQGSPLFTNPDAVQLTHQLSDLTISTQCQFNSNIVLNNGKILLNDNLLFADDRLMTRLWNC
jgi:hypothetical protein